MIVIKKIFKPLLSISLSVALFACNNSASTSTAKTDSTATDSTKAKDTVAAAPAPPPAFVPFDIVEINHTVKDYAKWRPFFNADSVNRKANGLEDFVVARIKDKPNDVQIVLKINDMEKGKAFGASPKLKEAMQKSGVISKPVDEMYHVLRFNPDSKEKQWVIITHKVKDFDAWLKVYDGEGKDKRMSQGMVDVALGRGIPDSSIVQIVFDIKDMAKAKAAIASEEKKKLMMSAGVEGKPRIIFYTQGD